MLNHWILIVIIQSVASYGQVSTSTLTQEFSTNAHCIQARESIINNAPERSQIKAFCAEK